MKDSALEIKGADPDWVKNIKHFYHDFPRNFRVRFRELTGGLDGNPYRNELPQMWKTVGDEIILCARVVDKRHLSLSVLAFVNAIQDYGSHLDGKTKLLDVKGSAWIAVFPIPNVTVKIAFNDDVTEDDVGRSGRPISNEFEIEADENPSRFDFLGRHIDGGFRISKHAASDEFVISPELAYFLADYCHNQTEIFRFYYIGRQVLKGINEEAPYPVFAIDTERSPEKRSLRTKERILNGQTKAEPLVVMGFLALFLKDRAIEVPVLRSKDGLEESLALPKSYTDYCLRWRQEEDDTARSIALQIESETAVADLNEGSTVEVSAFLENVAVKSEEEHPSDTPPSLAQ